MSEFLQTVFRIFGQAVGPAAAVMIFGTMAWARVYSRRHKEEKELPLRRAVPVALLMAYLGGLVAITLFIRTAGSDGIQWHLFCAFRVAWNSFTLENWLYPLLNIGMFVPMGVLLPLTAKVFRRWYVTPVVGFGSSLLIEAIQYIFVLGIADVDDLFCNTLGAALGYCVCMTVLSFLEKRRAAGAAYAVFPVLCAAVLAGTFITYYIQPYGNLADGPTFAAKTAGIEWVLECELSDTAEPVGIYYAEPFDKASCMAFGREFAQRMGLQIEYELDYDDTIWFQRPSFSDEEPGFTLIVTLADRSYRFEYNTETGQALIWAGRYGELTEEELRAALLEAGIEVPSAAVFSYDGDGIHTFRADRVIEDDTLTDGTVTCTVAENGEICEVDYAMSVCTLRAVEPILSETEAYEQLRRGEFSHGYWFEHAVFEHYALQEVHVLSCTLDYVTDTKGFRQPVYVFELEGLYPVFVPALAG